MHHVSFIGVDSNMTHLDLPQNITYSQKTLIIMKKFLHFFSPSVRMSGKNIIFNDKKINKSNFYKSKKLFKIGKIDFDKLLIWNKEPYGAKNLLKYFIEYNDDGVIRTLCIKHYV